MFSMRSLTSISLFTQLKDHATSIDKILHLIVVPSSSFLLPPHTKLSVMSLAYRSQQQILSCILQASKQNFSPQLSIAIVVHIYNPTSTSKKCKICIELTLLVGNSHRVGYIYSSEILLKIFCRSPADLLQIYFCLDPITHCLDRYKCSRHNQLNHHGLFLYPTYICRGSDLTITIFCIQRDRKILY